MTDELENAVSEETVEEAAGGVAPKKAKAEATTKRRRATKKAEIAESTPPAQEPREDTEPEEEEELSNLELIVTGAPIPFEVNGIKLALRQPEPYEYDLIRLQEDIAYQQAMEFPGMDDLDHMPVSKDALLARGMQIQEVKQQLETEKDPKKIRRLDARLQRLKAVDNRTRAEERATIYSQRVRDRWMVERFLVAPDGGPLDEEVRQRLLRFPSFYNEARPAAWRVLLLMSEPPNLNGHRG